MKIAFLQIRIRYLPAGTKILPPPKLLNGKLQNYLKAQIPLHFLLTYLEYLLTQSVNRGSIFRATIGNLDN